MCWNAEVSLTTFITSSLLCAYLWYRNYTNDRVIALWVFSFAIMQLLEFFMWIDLDDHSFVSKISLASLYAQPLVLATALLLFGSYHKLYNNQVTKIFIYGVIGLMIYKVIYSLYYAFIEQKDIKWSSTIGKNCHLVWHFMNPNNKLSILPDNDYTYYISLFILSLIIKPYGFIYTLVGCITNNISRWIYGDEEIGSMWCWIINILPLIAIGTKYI